MDIENELPAAVAVAESGEEVTQNRPRTPVPTVWHKDITLDEKSMTWEAKVKGGGVVVGTLYLQIQLRRQTDEELLVSYLGKAWNEMQTIVNRRANDILSPGPLEFQYWSVTTQRLFSTLNDQHPTTELRLSIYAEPAQPDLAVSSWTTVKQFQGLAAASKPSSWDADRLAEKEAAERKAQEAAERKAQEAAERMAKERSISHQLTEVKRERENSWKAKKKDETRSSKQQEHDAAPEGTAWTRAELPEWLGGNWETRDASEQERNSNGGKTCAFRCWSGSTETSQELIVSDAEELQSLMVQLSHKLPEYAEVSVKQANYAGAEGGSYHVIGPVLTNPDLIKVRSADGGVQILILRTDIEMHMAGIKRGERVDITARHGVTSLAIYFKKTAALRDALVAAEILVVPVPAPTEARAAAAASAAAVAAAPPQEMLDIMRVLKNTLVELQQQYKPDQRDIGYTYYAKEGLTFREGEVVGLKLERIGKSDMLIKKLSLGDTRFGVITERAHTRIPLDQLDGYDHTYAVCIIGTVPVRIDEDVAAGESVGVRVSGTVGAVARDAPQLGTALSAGVAGSTVSCLVKLDLQPTEPVQQQPSPPSPPPPPQHGQVTPDASAFPLGVAVDTVCASCSKSQFSSGLRRKIACDGRLRCLFPTCQWQLRHGKNGMGWQKDLNSASLLAVHWKELGHHDVKEEGNAARVCVHSITGATKYEKTSGH